MLDFVCGINVYQVVVAIPAEVGGRGVTESFFGHTKESVHHHE